MLGLVVDSLQGSYNEGRLYCTYTREKSVDQSTPGSNMIANLSNSFYIFLAAGPTDDTGKVLYK